MSTHKRKYNDLIEAAEADPRRDEVSTETSVNWSKCDDRAWVVTAHPALMRRLLSQEHFELSWYETTNEGLYGYDRVSAGAYDGDHDKRKPVHAVAGTVPVGSLKIKASSRRAESHAHAVSQGENK